MIYTHHWIVLMTACSMALSAEAQTSTQLPIKKPAAPVVQKLLVPQKTAAPNNPFAFFGAPTPAAGGQPASTLSPQAQKFLNPGPAAPGNNMAAMKNSLAAGNNPLAGIKNPLAGVKNPLASFMHPTSAATTASTPTANVMQRAVASGPQVAAKGLPGFPAPRGGAVMQGKNGSIIRTASDGSVLDVHNPNKGMVIHHAADGSRRVMVQQPDRSRAYIPARGVAYVQHPYTFNGQQLDSRTFVVSGQLYHQVYRPYTYGGTNLDVYATSRYYTPKFYQWVATRGPAKPFAWPYNTFTPWYGHYQGYFTPDSAYQSPTQWLTDFMLAATLYVAYTTKGQQSDPPLANAAPVTPEVKKMLTEEIEQQVKQESVEASNNAQNRDPQTGEGSVVQELSDHRSHVFLVSSDLDLVDPSGRRCALSEADVVQVTSSPKPDSGSVDAVVLSSKGGTECGASVQVEIALNDVQEMQNHMRAVIDQGMAAAPAQTQGPTQTPAFAAAAPAADPNATKEIEQQTDIAAAADG